MHRPSSRNVVAALSRRASRTGLRAAMLGAIAFALPTHILAQGAHATAPQATAPVVAEAPFLKENEAAMIKMMNDIRSSRQAISTATAEASAGRPLSGRHVFTRRKANRQEITDGF